MHRRIALVGLLAVTSCGRGSERAVETEVSPLVAVTHRLLHDDPAGGCDTRDYAGDGDWFPNYCKTECAGPATGISSSFPGQGGSCGLQFVTPPLDPGPGPGPDPGSPIAFHFEEFSHRLACGDDIAPAVQQGTGYALNFGTANDRRSPMVTIAGWASDPNLLTGECDDYSAIVGVASDHYWHTEPCAHEGGTTAKRAYGIVGARCSTLASPAGTFAVASGCQVLDFTSTSVNEAGGGTSWVGNDWDFGFYKAECGSGRYVKGIAHTKVGTGSSRATKILCCSPQYITIPG